MASSKVGDAAATQVSLGSETDKGRTEESPVIPKIYQHITVVSQVVPCDLTDFKGTPITLWLALAVSIGPRQIRELGLKGRWEEALNLLNSLSSYLGRRGRRV